MEPHFTPEQVKALESEFKEFLADKDNILHLYHTTLNAGFSVLPNKGVLTYVTKEKRVRGEMVGSDGNTFYTWWTSEDILGFAIVSTISGMFSTPEAIERNSLFIIAGIDLREKFIDMVNISIDIIHKVSEEWNICIL